MGDHVRDRSPSQHVPISDVCEPVTAFRLVHVMGRDQDREALAGELVNLIPEIAASFRINPSRGFVEK